MQNVCRTWSVPAILHKTNALAHKLEVHALVLFAPCESLHYASVKSLGEFIFGHTGSALRTPLMLTLCVLCQQKTSCFSKAKQRLTVFFVAKRDCINFDTSRSRSLARIRPKAGNTVAGTRRERMTRFIGEHSLGFPRKYHNIGLQLYGFR